MEALVIFWAAAFAMLFFVLGVVFKALASAFSGLMDSAGVLGIGVMAVVVVLALVLLEMLVDSIIRDGFWEVVGWILLLCFVLSIVIGIVVAIIGGLGALLLGFAVYVAEIVFLFVSEALEWLADKCERGYIMFLKVIINRLDKC